MYKYLIDTFFPMSRTQIHAEGLENSSNFHTNSSIASVTELMAGLGKRCSLYSLDFDMGHGAAADLI
jgi:hypothetical protein